jgi:dUTP pyrophosphatase
VNAGRYVIGAAGVEAVEYTYYRGGIIQTEWLGRNPQYPKDTLLSSEKGGCGDGSVFWIPAKGGRVGYEVTAYEGDFLLRTEAGHVFAVSSAVFEELCRPQDKKEAFPSLRFKRAGSAPHDWPLPSRATPGSAGLDLAANLTEAVTLAPMGIMTVGTGWAVEIPPGFEGQIRPRSGLAFRESVTLLCQGTVDSDYRGELKLLMINLGAVPRIIRPGQRLAQLVVSPCLMSEPEEAEALSGTGRGEAGFGSTGD